MAAFTAAGTSYATHGEPMIPVYVFYSMFGFQRTGDPMWAAMDQMARGFIIGATAGRTTLTGEGLQHADGHSPMLAATNPAVKIYDPAYGYEIAHIVRAGLEQMYGPDSDDPNVMYYLTVYNEPMLQPAEPEDVDVEGIVRGLHRISGHAATGRRCSCWPPGCRCRGRWRPPAAGAGLGGQRGRLVGDLVDGAAPRRPRGGGAQLPHPGRGGAGAVRDRAARDSSGPVIASTDYVSDVPDQIRQFLPNPFATLGADGHGFSDTRPAARRFFHIDTASIVVRALQMLAASR